MILFRDTASIIAAAQDADEESDEDVDLLDVSPV
jgi:hypothetical protein